MKLLKKALHMHWHVSVHRDRFYDYKQCRCGRRKIAKLNAGTMSPKDRGWLQTGEWTKAPTSPPPRPGDCL